MAVSLRELGHAGPITLVGAEAHAPYQRPPLSKAYLKREATSESLSLREETFWPKQQIELRLGVRVHEVDLGRGRARTALGGELAFDRLALTTGARVRRLTLPGAELDNVLYLRSLDDADHLAAALSAAERIVVVGGGFIGLEAAAAARSKGKQVTLVEALPRLIMRAVAPVVSEFYLQAHRRRGTRIMLSEAVTHLEGREGRVTGVQLASGAFLHADLVLVGIGIVPRTELAESAGLEVRDGIVVDRCARTSDPRVVAAGDCTVFPSPMAPHDMVRLESVQNAVDQAKVAAATLMDQPSEYAATPWFWSDQDDLKLQIAGLSNGFDDVVLRGEPLEERFTAVYFQGDRLLAADCVNRAADYVTIRRALSQGATVRRDGLDDLSVPLKSLVVMP